MRVETKWRHDVTRSQRDFSLRIFVLFHWHIKDEFHLAVSALSVQVDPVQTETVGPWQGLQECAFLIHEFARACHSGRTEGRPPDFSLTVELHRAREPVDGCKPGDLTIVAELDKWSFTREMVFVPVYGHLLENPLYTGYPTDILGGDESLAAPRFVTSRPTADKAHKAQSNNQEATRSDILLS